MASSFAELPLIFWVIAVVAVLLIGISKAGFDGSLVVAATPLLSIIIPVAEAAALLLPVLIIADFMSIGYYRKEFDQLTLKRLLPAAIIGIALGGLFFTALRDQERILKIFMGVIALGFVAFQLSRAVLFKKVEKWDPPLWAGLVLGTIAGFTSTIAHVGGPLASIYMLPQQFPRRIFVGTTVFLFTAVNLVKLIPYSMLGLIQFGNLLITATLIPVAFIGVRLGLYLNGRISQKLFERIIYTFLTLTGIHLIMGDSLTALLFK